MGLVQCVMSHLGGAQSTSHALGKTFVSVSFIDKIFYFIQSGEEVHSLLFGIPKVNNGNSSNQSAANSVLIK